MLISTGARFSDWHCGVLDCVSLEVPVHDNPVSRSGRHDGLPLFVRPARRLGDAPKAGLLAHSSNVLLNLPSSAYASPVALENDSLLTVAGAATDCRLDADHRVPFSPDHALDVPGPLACVVSRAGFLNVNSPNGREGECAFRCCFRAGWGRRFARVQASVAMILSTISPIVAATMSGVM